MEWAQIRSHYAKLLAEARRAGVTQDSVAKAGKLPGQNAISKLLANHNLGPSVETFVKAVRGLGKEVSVFFAEIEHIPTSLSAPPRPERPLIDRIRDLELALEAIASSSLSSSQPSTLSSSHGPGVEASLGPTNGRPHGVNSSVSGSGPGVVNHISTSDHGERQFEALVKTHLEMLTRRLDRCEDRMDERRGADRNVDPAAPAPSARDRRRA